MDNLHESSMNFDDETLRPFLERISGLIDGGFGSTEIDQVVTTSKSMELDEERDLEFKINFQGAESPFIVRIFMDDIDAPDVAFFGPEDLAEKIDDEMDAFMEEMGI